MTAGCENDSADDFDGEGEKGEKPRILGTRVFGGFWLFIDQIGKCKLLILKDKNK